MQEQSQDMFQMHYYITSKGINVTLKDPVYSPNLEKAKEIASLLEGEDYLYISRVVHDPNQKNRPKRRYTGIHSGLNKWICTGIQQRIAIEKQPYGFSVDLSSSLMPYYRKECTLAEVIEVLDNIDDYMKDPDKYGFEISGP